MPDEIQKALSTRNAGLLRTLADNAAEPQKLTLQLLADLIELQDQFPPETRATA